MHFESNGSDDSSRPTSSSSQNATVGSSPARAKPTSAAQNPDQNCSCAYCGSPFKRSETRSMPFCSTRCQQIDLGMWLNESYGLPHEGEDAVADYDYDLDE